MARTERWNKVKSRDIFQTIYANILLNSDMSFQQKPYSFQWNKITHVETKKIQWLAYFKQALYFMPVKYFNCLVSKNSWFKGTVYHPASTISNA